MAFTQSLSQTFDYPFMQFDQSGKVEVLFRYIVLHTRLREHGIVAA
jgi:hypothetical protein